MGATVLAKTVASKNDGKASPKMMAKQAQNGRNLKKPPHTRKG